MIRRTSFIFFLSYTFISLGFAQDPGWPRSINKNGAQLIYYQPQVDDWKDNKQLYARMAASLTPAGEKSVVGVVSIRLTTDVDADAHTVLLKDPQIIKTYFPSLDPTKAKQMDQMIREMLPPTASMTISLERLIASVDKSKIPKHTAQLKNDPPKIFVSHGPAILVLLDGKPVRAPIKDTKLESVVNANWPLFYDKSGSKYYLLADKQWLAASDLQQEWTLAKVLPKDMSKLLKDPNWADLKGTIPPPQSTGPATPPQVFYSDTPAEVIVFKGQPVYSKIPGTQLVFATNTDSDVFVDSSNNAYYYQTSGRWFSSPKLTGPWTYASDKLPKDFAKIPADSPAYRVLVAVPGTPEAEDAVLMAQIPTSVVVDPVKAAENVKVSYTGEPRFTPIEGTSLSYASNSPEKVIKMGDLYYLCFQGVWFKSTNAQGPWQTAESIPQEIYTIPASSPVYNVTYVTQTTTSDGQVEASYTAGYLGTFVTGVAVGAVIAGGTGYYYPPYVYYPAYGYPVYRPYAATYGAGYYNPYTRTYGYGGAAYGAYGGARWGTGYNASTGTYARGGTAYGPYGSRSAGQAYNPYTGAYGATRQGSNAYSQWGSSVVTRGNQTAVGQHYSTARGTVGSVQTSSGGRAVGSSTAYGNTYAGKTTGGDMYAGRDGSVYKNANGGWQKYDNGNWNSVNTEAAQQRAQSYQQQRSSMGQSGSSARSSEMQGVQNDYQSRQRGAAQSQRVQSFSRGGGRRR
jgi:hypothetical protein